MVLADRLNRRSESVAVNGSSPPVVGPPFADLVDFAKSAADRVVKVLGRQGPSLVLGFCGEPLTSALPSAALTFGVEFVEVPVLSVDRAPVADPHRDENAFGSVDELRCSQLHPGVGGARTGGCAFFSSTCSNSWSLSPARLGAAVTSLLPERIRRGARGLVHSCASFRSEPCMVDCA